MLDGDVYIEITFFCVFCMFTVSNGSKLFQCFFFTKMTEPPHLPFNLLYNSSPLRIYMMVSAIFLVFEVDLVYTQLGSPQILYCDDAFQATILSSGPEALVV